MDTKTLLKNALMVSEDPNWYGVMSPKSKEDCIRSLEKYFDKFNGKMTDVLLCVLEQTTILPSKYHTWRGEKFLQKKENGIDVDYPFLEGLYKGFSVYGVDGVQIFIDTMKKKGIRPWITLRMNDAHHGSLPTSFLRPDAFYEAAEAGEIIGEEYGYYEHCFDFTYPKYRNAILGYIGEILDKYDFFGLELDFMREIRCFDYKNNPECHKIITEYMREVKKLVTKAEGRVGHKITVSIRTCRSHVDALEFGFDIKTMVDEGLVDVVVPSPRWNPSDSAIPIAEWRELLGDKITIIAGIETTSMWATIQKPEMTKAYTAVYYDEGADGIYYNNHEAASERNLASWSITRENCLEGRREFVVTFNDCYSDTSRRYKPLPLTFDGAGELPLKISLVKPTDKVKVMVDFEGDAPPTLSALDKKNVAATVIEPLVYDAIGEKTKVVTEHTPLCYDMSGISTKSDVTLSFNGTGTIHYLTIIIDAE